MNNPEIIINKECDHYYRKVLIDTIYELNSNFYTESLRAYYCKDCGSIFLFRHQYDPGCGSDCFEIYPGETVRGITLTEEEWLKYSNLLNNPAK